MARTPIPKPDGPNSRWSTDFVHDQLANGQRVLVDIMAPDTKSRITEEVFTEAGGGFLAIIDFRMLVDRFGPGTYAAQASIYDADELADAESNVIQFEWK